MNLVSRFVHKEVCILGSKFGSHSCSHNLSENMVFKGKVVYVHDFQNVLSEPVIKKLVLCDFSMLVHQLFESICPKMNVTNFMCSGNVSLCFSRLFCSSI